MCSLCRILFLPNVHCNETIPKIQNKYSQKRNCAATVPISTFIGLLYIHTIDLPILLQVDRNSENT
jgi:hypothetical protein